MKFHWILALSIVMGSKLFAQAPLDASSNAKPVPDPAAQGKLPPNKPTAPAKTPSQGAVTEISESEVKPVLLNLPECSSYLATPMETSILEHEKKIYFTSPKLPSDSGPATSYFLEVDLTEGKAKKIAGFRGGRFLSLKAHAPGQELISMFDFNAAKPHCAEGVTVGTAIDLKEQKVKPSFPSANYMFVAGDAMTFLAEPDKGLIQQVDISTGQRRTLERFSAGSRPLYLKSSPPVAIYTYNPQSKELSKFVASKKTADSILKLKEGMRLVRDGEKFGIAQAKQSSLQLVQIKGWSGDEMKTQDLPLPTGYQAASVAVKPLFDKQLAVVYGRDDSVRRSLRSMTIYSGSTPKTYKASDLGSYISQVEILRSGSVAALISEANSGAVKELWLITDLGEPRKIEILKSKKIQQTKMK